MVAILSRLQSVNMASVISISWHLKLECAASNGNRYPPYPQVMATAISQWWLPPSFAQTLTLEKKSKKKANGLASMLAEGN